MKVLIDEDNCHQNQEASSSNFSTSSSSRMNRIRDRIRDRIVEHFDTTNYGIESSKCNVIDMTSNLYAF